MVRIGCSGWVYDHWRGRVYPDRLPQRRWLEHYASLFDTVEVNATFYRLPRLETVARWAEVAPDGFVFSVKASRYLTHVRRLQELAGGVALLGERIAPLAEAGKLGPILWQLPATFTRDDDRLASALGELPPGRHAFEFRHASWFAEDVYALLAENGVALVAADRAGSPEPPLVDTAGWWYLRFHHGRGRAGRYTPAELRAWVGRIAGLEGDVWAYFNNDWEGFALANARSLRSFAGAAGLQPASSG
jgi:uncharacterized protein YecE (DUF72 family)